MSGTEFDFAEWAARHQGEIVAAYETADGRGGPPTRPSATDPADAGTLGEGSGGDADKSDVGVPTDPPTDYRRGPQPTAYAHPAAACPREGCDAFVVRARDRRGRLILFDHQPVPAPAGRWVLNGPYAEYLEPDQRFFTSEPLFRRHDIDCPGA